MLVLKFQAQDNKKKKISILPVPTFGYEPETETHIGAVSLFTLDFYQDSTTRVSNGKMEFNYTWRKQSIFEVQWNYFFKNEKWFTSGEIHVSKFPDYYYGVGQHTVAPNELLYESNRVIVDINVYKHLQDQLFFGMGLRYYDYRNIQSEVKHSFNELKDASIIGVKIELLKDKRDNLLNPTRGIYYNLETDYNHCSQKYYRFIADIRKYYTFKKNHVFATRFYNSMIYGTPTFFDYSILGGDDFVRGYYYGRFRELNLSTFQIESRFKIYRRWGVALIGGVSTLYDAIDEIGQAIRPNYGVGIRFLMDRKEKINLRLDYVRGNDSQSGFYISFGESF